MNLTNKKEISDGVQKKTPPPSFVKVAMRNMVRKGNQSLSHFALTFIGFLVFILLIAWIARPVLPS